MRSGQRAAAYPIDAPGPAGQTLSIEMLRIGSRQPRRALLVLSGVHGVEGFVGSALQIELIERLDVRALPADMAVLLVHGANPWGMAWGRRQNESNVDLNRNWRRDAGVPFVNGAYDVLHGVLCPDSAERPDVAVVLAAIDVLARERGIGWVRDGITAGQYGYPDGLHYGGDRTEPSTRIVEMAAGELLQGVERLLAIDLHTGHGASGRLTLLCDRPEGSPQYDMLAALSGADAVEVTVDPLAATTRNRAGQIVRGLAELFPQAIRHAATAEFGTVSDGRQLVYTVLEQWAYRHGRRDDPACADIVRGYRACFTPEDDTWAARVLPRGRTLLDAAVAAVAGWDTASASTRHRS
jgi:predicted deacylase